MNNRQEVCLTQNDIYRVFTHQWNIRMMPRDSQIVDNISPQVSVIIPAYNQAKYLESAIQSALSQTYQDYEIIVVDDGSTDNTPLIAGRFVKNIRYIRQDNQGLGGARNTGIRIANGHFVALLDSDDQWVPNFLEKMTGLAAQFPEAAVYYCQARCMDAEGHDLPQVLGGPVRPPEAIYQTLLRADFLIPSTILMRRSVIMKAGLFDHSLRYCEDWDLWLQILPEYTFIGIPDCLVRYRIHSNTQSANLAGNQQSAIALIKKKFGPDDNHEETWSIEKRRGYGGLYRFLLLIFVNRNNDWKDAAQNFRRALQIDPTLAEDLDLFYDLALGGQPPGYRGSPQLLNFKENTAQISTMLADTFYSKENLGIEHLRRQTYGTAYFALGLVAYNTGKFRLCRSFLIRALYYRPDLLKDNRTMGLLLKSFLSRKILNQIKKAMAQLIISRSDSSI